MSEHNLAADYAVAVQLTEPDYHKYSRIIMSPFKWRGWANYGIAVVFSAAITMATMNILTRVAWMPHNKWLILGILIAVYLVVVQLLLRRLMDCLRVSYNDSKGSFLAPSVLNVTPDGLQAESKHIKSTVAWPGVLRIQENSEYIIFYVDLIQAYLVPKRCFADAEQAREFLQQAQEFWRAAHPESLASHG